MNTNYIYLHKVDAAANNNKFYEMTNNGDGTFTVKYGREGAAKPATETYPISKWDSKYYEKTSSKKGYTDITDLKSVVKQTTSVSNSKKQLISKNPEVVKLITYLQEAANVVTKANYEVEAKQVTQAQVDKAQHQIDILSKIINIDEFNKELVQLMIIIPRKMKRVADHCMPATSSKKDLQKRIEEEQEMLDAMASQVVSDSTSDNATDTSVSKNDKTLLESLGLEMELCSDKAEINRVKDLVLSHKSRVKNIYKVRNIDTEKRYEKHLAAAKNKQTQLLFHGSRNQNWFFILQQGLKIRPSTAVITGAMFGNGVYFASDDDKSLGYTDSGRWVNNGYGKNSVFMGVYEVHLGDQIIKHSHDSSCYNLHNHLNGKDSVWAKKGPSLRKDEYIVYNTNQSTIKYLIEFSN